MPLLFLVFILFFFVVVFVLIEVEIVVAAFAVVLSFEFDGVDAGNFQGRTALVTREDVTFVQILFLNVNGRVTLGTSNHFSSFYLVSTVLLSRDFNSEGSARSLYRWITCWMQPSRHLTADRKRPVLQARP
jgi:hypothetical protein